MASAFVELVVRKTPRAQDAHLRDLPRELECRSEQVLPEGRADLAFRDASRCWHIIVEVKVYAGYGDTQIPRYLRSFDRASQRQILAAVTRDVPTYGEDAADDRWVGSVQWATLLPGLRALRPTNRQLASQWPLFLDVLESEGSMGFTAADPDLFTAWSKYVDARTHMVDFVDSVRLRLLDELRESLTEQPDRPNDPAARADFVTIGKVGKVVTPRLGKVLIRFRLPAGGQERLWAGMWGWGDPRFFVETAHPGEPTAAVKHLHAGGFESWNNKLLTRYLPLDRAMLENPTVLRDNVIGFSRSSFDAIVKSRILDVAADASAAAVVAENDV